MFNGNKLIEDAMFLIWTWLRHLEKDFSLHFNHWSTHIRQGFLYQQRVALLAFSSCKLNMQPYLWNSIQYDSYSMRNHIYGILFLYKVPLVLNCYYIYKYTYLCRSKKKKSISCQAWIWQFVKGFWLNFGVVGSFDPYFVGKKGNCEIIEICEWCGFGFYNSFHVSVQLAPGDGTTIPLSSFFCCSCSSQADSS